jgi:hypothetical protein
MANLTIDSRLGHSILAVRVAADVARREWGYGN